MTKILTSPVVRDAVGKAVVGVVKLGILAASNMFATTIFRTATQEFIGVTLQDWRKVRSI